MERKTTIKAEEGKQELTITREFDLPLDLLFRAYTVPELLEQWMGTNVLKLDNKKYGSWQFETTDVQGNVLFRANGVIHEFIPNQKITRTFEMENTPFGIQLEFLEFEQIADEASRLRMQVVYRSVTHRDQMLRVGMGMAKGINIAHNRLQEVASKLAEQ